MTPDMLMDTLMWGIFFGLVELAMEWVKENGNFPEPVAIGGLLVLPIILLIVAPSVFLIALIVYLCAKGKGVMA